MFIHDQNSRREFFIVDDDHNSSGITDETYPIPHSYYLTTPIVWWKKCGFSSLLGTSTMVSGEVCNFNRGNGIMYINYSWFVKRVTIGVPHINTPSNISQPSKHQM